MEGSSNITILDGFTITGGDANFDPNEPTKFRLLPQQLEQLKQEEEFYFKMREAQRL